MKHRVLLYLLLVAALCVGCGGRIGMRQLNELEACVNDVPDSVLAVLTAADMPRWGEARALYALLTVQAQDRALLMWRMTRSSAWLRTITLLRAMHGIACWRFTTSRAYNTTCRLMCKA